MVKRPREVTMENKIENKKGIIVSPSVQVERDTSEKKDSNVPDLVYVPPIPFPQPVVQAHLEKRYGKFLEILKQLHVSIPFTELISQMPTYVKFLKEILAKKRSVESIEIVMLTEECSSILLNELPPKLKDPGSFTIPCMINDVNFDKALCDLGASINLMSVSLFNKLALTNLKPSKVSLQLVDSTIRFPKGVVEDVLVKVDKFTFPVDFLVLDMEENHEVPLILGRPFLATGRSLIDMQQGELILRVQEESVTFQIFDPPIPSPNSISCYDVDATNDLCAKCVKSSIKPSNTKSMVKVARAKVLLDDGKGLSCLVDTGQSYSNNKVLSQSIVDNKNSSKSRGCVHLDYPRSPHEGDPD